MFAVTALDRARKKKEEEEEEEAEKEGEEKGKGGRGRTKGRISQKKEGGEGSEREEEGGPGGCCSYHLGEQTAPLSHGPAWLRGQQNHQGETEPCEAGRGCFHADHQGCLAWKSRDCVCGRGPCLWAVPGTGSTVDTSGRSRLCTLSPYMAFERYLGATLGQSRLLRTGL